MHCFDCAARGDDVPAVAVCNSCGAGVCLTCSRTGRQAIRHDAAFMSAEVLVTETRTIACPSCSDALAEHHADRYRFTANSAGKQPTH
jgi:hypothetical protein